MKSTPPPADAGASLAKEAPPDREGVLSPAGVLGHPRSSVGVRPDSAHFDLLSGETFVSISGPGFSFPRLRVARKPDGSGFDLFDEAPATPAPFNPAHQGGLHRWPLDLAPPVALHGSPEEP